MPFSDPKLEAIRELAANDALGEALRAVEAWLKSEASSELKVWLGPLTNLQARFHRLEVEEVQRILSAEVVEVRRNQIRADLTKLLEKLAAQELPALPRAKQRKAAAGWMAAVVSVGLLIVAYFIFVRQPSAEQPSATQILPPLTQTEVAQCPDFSASDEFKVMVLPYQVLKGDAISLHLLVSQKIGQLIDRHNIHATVRSFGRKPEDVPQYPDSPRAAERLGKNCGAQLVVWGLTQSDDEKEESITSFRFVDGDRWRFTEFKLDENLQVDTLKSLAAMAMDASFTAKIEQAFLLIFGIIAREAGEQEQVIALLEEAAVEPQSDPAVFELQQNLLAEAYQTKGLTDKAIDAYTKILAVNPDNASAAQNRGTLFYHLEAYDKAAADLDKAITLEPDRKEAIVTRLATNLQRKRSDLIDKDLHQLENDYKPSGERITAPQWETNTPATAPREEKATPEDPATQRRFELLLEKSSQLRPLLPDRRVISPDLLVRPRVILPRDT